MNGVMKVSSAELADKLGLTPSQVRTDLGGFVGAGQQGYGYNVKLLYTEISRELGAGDRMTAVIIGGGAAMAEHLAVRFEGRGVTTVAHVTDGEGKGSLPMVAPAEMASFLAENAIDLAVVSDWTGEIGVLTETLVKGGIRGVWNMSQRDMDADIPVLNLPLGDILMSLCCDVRHGEVEGKEKEL
jgi:redox-sensing transcriptional repressor